MVALIFEMEPVPKIIESHHCIYPTIHQSPGTELAMENKEPARTMFSDIILPDLTENMVKVVEHSPLIMN